MQFTNEFKHITQFVLLGTSDVYSFHLLEEGPPPSLRDSISSSSFFTSSSSCLIEGSPDTVEAAMFPCLPDALL